MFDTIKDVLGELNARINAINEELNVKMSSQTTASSNDGSTNPSNGSNGSAHKGHSSSIANAHQVQYCGPYKLEKTLGKGQTGLVKTGTHCITGRKVAVKIVNKEKLNESVLQKVEREIAIMKLIEHPHVLHLYDVYENKKYLYLLLEHVSGGELFDYLVRKGRLMAKEARKFFRQIISALDFCHAHNICHRDLKPENLLLDERNNIKVADFGMASLQVEGSMLETSCGSPHYACPEVIRGEKYDGRKADVWSCGVILYALLVGALPFDDDNLRNLLEKVKKGVFHIPHFVPSDCQNLLRSMIEVDPQKRISLQEVFRHPWIAGNTRGEAELELPMAQVVQTHIIPMEENIDPDVFRHMNNLGCFKEKDKLIRELLSPKHNTEKMVYFLLLDRKRRRPAQEDETEVVLRHSNQNMDPPRKRTDTSKPNRYPFGSISEGSPINPRKTYGRYSRHRHSSLGGSPNGSPRSSIHNFYQPATVNASSLIATARQANPTVPTVVDDRRGTSSARASYHHYTQPVDAAALADAARSAKSRREPPSAINRQQQNMPHDRMTNDSMNSVSVIGSNASSSSSLASGSSTANVNSPSGPWRSKLSTIKNSFLGTPRFHRRKLSAGSSAGESDSEDSVMLDTTDLVKKSWFGSLTSNMGIERDDVQCVPVEGKSLNGIKAELIRSFLTIHELSHSVVGQNSFKVEYKRGPAVGGGVFSRGVKMQVDIIVSAHSDSPDRPLYVVQFTLLAGPTRRFRRLVDHLSAVLQSSSQQRSERAQQAALMVRPRRLSDSSVSSACSDNETNNYVNVHGMATNVLPHVHSQNDRVETRSYICSRSGSNTSNTGTNSNIPTRIDHQGIAGGSLRISSTSNSANSAKNSNTRRNTAGAVLDNVGSKLNVTNPTFGQPIPSRNAGAQQQQRKFHTVLESPGIKIIDQPPSVAPRSAGPRSVFNSQELSQSGSSQQQTLNQPYDDGTQSPDSLDARTSSPYSHVLPSTTIL
uniref:non-specific serine/threonine protein kinase n=1 Tax=Panagrellus redivivus TaxID=6233 RepID=A0A7E4VFW7_PANRE